MRASMWWIDRWRKSTAYTDMSAEQQGLYRNLCDEVVLREDGIIPEASLAKASGDAAAWPRNAAVVLRWMVKAKGGWTNKTALEVKAKGEEVSKKQRVKAQARWSKDSRGSTEIDAAASTTAYAAASSTAVPRDMPSVSVSVVRSPLPEPEQRTTDSGAVAPPIRAVVRRPATPSWSGQAVDDYRERYGPGSGHGGQIGNGLKPLVLANTWVVVRAAWRRYLGLGPGPGTTHPSPSAQDLAAHFADWLPDGRGPETNARSRGVLSIMAEGLALPRILEPREVAELERTGNDARGGAHGAPGAAAEGGGRTGLEATGPRVVEVPERRQRG